jgi:CRISPR-associated protein Cmr4
MSQQANLIVGLIAQTSIHAGAGSSAGVVDLPIQREGHNGWPCIFGSSVKGALRAKADAVFKDDQPLIDTIFGPASNSDITHAGAISVGDARLLLLPIRSLTSAFKWVTCPAALSRYERDLGMLGKSLTLSKISVSGESQALWSAENDDLYLEEYRFEAEQQDLSATISAIASLVNREGFEETLEKQLVIVSDDMFAYLVQNATPVNAHIAINSDGSKTVKDGALWYEETLPPETVLYTPIMANSSRVPKAKEGEAQPTRLDALAVANMVENGLFAESNKWLQVGGNETVGMGWCAVTTELVGGR